MTRIPRVTSFAGLDVFLTGAASGIGRALAEELGRDGARLHLTDIDAATLATVAERLRRAGCTVVLAEPADVSDYPAVHALATRVTEASGAMDLVLNVAGIATWGTVSGLEHRDWQRLIEVNLMGPIHVIETLVPAMAASGRGGHLVNVASAAGIIGLPWHAAYSASKFGLRGVSEVLRFDLAAAGIGVHLVCPGAVDTGLTETVRIAGVDKTSPAFAKAHARFTRRAVTPAQASAAILAGVRDGDYWIYTSADIRAMHRLQRYCPPAHDAVMRGLNRVARRSLPAVGRAERSDLIRARR